MSIPPKPEPPKIVIQREDGCGGAVVVGLLILALTWTMFGCAKDAPDRFASYRNGQSVTVKADNRQGVVISSYPTSDPTRQGETDYLVKFENAKPQLGQKYTTKGFRYDQLSDSE